MTKFFAICGCVLVAVNAVDRAIGGAASHPIPDEYRWVWFIVALGWALISYRVWADLNSTRLSGRAG